MAWLEAIKKTCRGCFCRIMVTPQNSSFQFVIPVIRPYLHEAFSLCNRINICLCGWTSIVSREDKLLPTLEEALEVHRSLSKACLQIYAMQIDTDGTHVF